MKYRVYDSLSSPKILTALQSPKGKKLIDGWIHELTGPRLLDFAAYIRFVKNKINKTTLGEAFLLHIPIVMVTRTRVSFGHKFTEKLETYRGDRILTLELLLKKKYPEYLDKDGDWIRGVDRFCQGLAIANYVISTEWWKTNLNQIKQKSFEMHLLNDVLNS